ncbi:MAG: LamB/YcsF family protein [Micropruina sp.]|nr:LamB/YcsF family protein [Micropruina sp.]
MVADRPAPYGRGVTGSDRTLRIDLNSDLGEGSVASALDDDAAMLQLVSSANIACGFHAGDPRGIRSTLELAVANGVVVGAHVSYRDLAGFGRRDLDVAPAELTAETIYQLGAMQALAASVGTRVDYVKPHGALYNRIVHDEQQAAAVVRAVVAVDPSLVLLGLPGAVVLELAAAAGIRTVTEAFADRAYTPTGRLVPRSQPGAVLHDPDRIADRVLRLVHTGLIEAIDGSQVAVSADSICVHGDTPDAVSLARAVRDRLIGAGVSIGPFTPGA